jgi:hypothetical protein
VNDKQQETKIVDQGTGSKEKASAPQAAPAIPVNGAPPPLERAPLAYENPAFLNSADGRVLRIAAEYLSPWPAFATSRFKTPSSSSVRRVFAAAKRPITPWNCSTTPVQAS